MQVELNLFGKQVLIETEEWKQIQEFPLYEVSNMGRFRRIKNGKIVAGSISHNGYQHIGLLKDGKQVWKLAHRIVAATFLEKPSENHNDVNHDNKIRSDNRVSNLQWMTRSENSIHAKRK